MLVGGHWRCAKHYQRGVQWQLVDRGLLQGGVVSIGCRRIKKGAREETRGCEQR